MTSALIHTNALHEAPHLVIAASDLLDLEIAAFECDDRGVVRTDASTTDFVDVRCRRPRFASQVRVDVHATPSTGYLRLLVLTRHAAHISHTGAELKTLERKPDALHLLWSVRGESGVIWNTASGMSTGEHFIESLPIGNSPLASFVLTSEGTMTREELQRRLVDYAQQQRERRRETFYRLIHDRMIVAAKTRIVLLPGEFGSIADVEAALPAKYYRYSTLRDGSVEIELVLH